MDLAISKNGFRFESAIEIMQTLTLVGIGGVLAFAMEVAEVAIIQIASSLTLSMINVTKEVVLVTISIIRTNEDLVPVNIAGMVICMIGFTAHIARNATQPTEQSIYHAGRLPKDLYN